MATTSTLKLSARERLLEAADELFYQEGIHTVGIDRIIERAGVAKASLYQSFSGKEELIRVYLERRQQLRRERMEQVLAPLSAPRERLLGVFDALAQRMADPSFRGCAFLRASAESPADVIAEACASSRSWLHSLIHDLAVAAGVGNPVHLARQLVLLYDGAIVSAYMDHRSDAAHVARSIAEGIMDRALRPGSA